MAGSLRVAIDASAARMGGGASRVTELALTLADVAPHHDYVFALTPELAEGLSDLPPRSHVLSVPRSLDSVIGRIAWEHVYLPSALARIGVDWVLSPFGVLPLGPGLPREIRRAVIVSNIG